MIKPSCYSCRKTFEPDELRLHYSKNYCEPCGVGLFGDDYFGFPQKPSPGARKNLAVHLAVLALGAGVFWLWFQAW